jgi:hypothetical protein
VNTPQENQEPTPEGQKTSWPTAEQRRGIDISLEAISVDIDYYLNDK